MKAGLRAAGADRRAGRKKKSENKEKAAKNSLTVRKPSGNIRTSLNRGRKTRRREEKSFKI
jgi:uncharacterized protein (UPF0218 family)